MCNRCWSSCFLKNEGWDLFTSWNETTCIDYELSKKNRKKVFQWQTSKRCFNTIINIDYNDNRNCVNESVFINRTTMQYNLIICLCVSCLVRPLMDFHLQNKWTYRMFKSCLSFALNVSYLEYNDEWNVAFIIHMWMNLISFRN